VTLLTTYCVHRDVDTEVPAVLHGADLKAMLKEVHFRTAEQKAAAHEKAHAEKGRMMDLVSTVVCLFCQGNCRYRTMANALSSSSELLQR
jgi:hypothetical protein